MLPRLSSQPVSSFCALPERRRDHDDRRPFPIQGGGDDPGRAAGHGLVRLRYRRQAANERGDAESFGMASLAWPVWALIFRDETPACVALVANPARKLWPEKPEGSMPAAAARSLTISDTASPDSRSVAMRPCRSTGRWSIPDTESQ
jgi:hypothetical protein